MTVENAMDTSRTVREIEAREMEEQPYNAGDPKQVNEARSRAKRRKIKQLAYEQKIMQDPEGQQWMWNLLTDCHIHGNPVVPGDTHQTYFQLGEQNIGKRLLSSVMQFPDLYVQMAQRAQDGFK